MHQDDDESVESEDGEAQGNDLGGSDATQVDEASDRHSVISMTPAANGIDDDRPREVSLSEVGCEMHASFLTTTASNTLDSLTHISMKQMTIVKLPEVVKSSWNSLFFLLERELFLKKALDVYTTDHAGDLQILALE